MSIIEVDKIRDVLCLSEKNAVAFLAYLLDLFDSGNLTMFYCDEDYVEVGYDSLDEDVKEFIDFIRKELNLEVSFDENENIFYVKCIGYEF